MLRPRVPPSAPPSSNERIPDYTTNISNGGGEKSKYSKRSRILPNIPTLLFLMATLVMGVVIGSSSWLSNGGEKTNTRSATAVSPQNALALRTGNNEDAAMMAFRAVERRSLTHRDHCHAIGLDSTKEAEQQLLNLNNHTAHLPQFGFIKALSNYNAVSLKQSSYPYQCELPPETECNESHFTVIFMAYNPDRLSKMFGQIKKMLDGEFAPLVAEIVVVWNGERHVEETPLGKDMVDYAKTHPLRISYPLKAGFPNDLLNRYHPRLDVKTKAIMYYDDDGPFYSFKATLGGFELWKRNSNAQIGAMARKLDLGPRQADESKAILNGPGDRFFISQCPTDSLDYNYREFANFGARMVLPSGSFLHSNYLCFLWHPVFEEIRQYVRRHPVNPDDGTVSTLVSQLAGRAPKVYPRRINEKEEGSSSGGGDASSKQEQQRRRLMDGINWDKAGGHSKKMDWGRLRGDAANSLARYFGSINSGSLGWCYGTPYQSGEYCKPEMARVGMLPWMKLDHTPRDTCP